MSQLLISDANILIDLEDGELIAEFFTLPFEFHVPDLLFADELEESHGHLLEYGLKLIDLYKNKTILNQYVITITHALQMNKVVRHQ